jgi:hypothetical protein
MFWREGPDSFVAAPYNVFLVPEGDANIAVEAQTMKFHCEHNMDFNRWLYDGVPYVNTSEEVKLRQRYLEPQVISETDAKIHVAADLQEFVDNIMTDLSNWVRTDETRYEIHDANGFQRKQLYM